MRKIRTAIVGLGWAGLHRHLPTIKKHESFDLVGVIDPEANKAHDIAKRFSLQFSTQGGTLNAAPWLNEVEAVVIATPPTSHAPLILESLAHNKHVLVEKPFARDLYEADAMAQAARTSDCILASVHNFLFCRAYTKLKRDLQNGSLGHVSRIAGIHRCNPNNSPPSWHQALPLGAFSNEAPHFLYLIRDLAGESLHLRRAYGVPPLESGTLSHVHLLFCNDTHTPITLDYQFTGGLSEWHLIVSGEKSTALVDLYRDIYIRLPNDGRHRAIDVLRTSLSTFLQHGTQHITNGFALLSGTLDYGTRTIYDRFAKAIRTQKQDETIGYSASLAITQIQNDVTKVILGNLTS